MEGGQEESESLHAFMMAIENKKLTVQECALALYDIASVLDRVWQKTIGNDALWQARIDGPVYRKTFILGHFRWYRRIRVWYLRKHFILC